MRRANRKRSQGWRANWASLRGGLGFILAFLLADRCHHDWGEHFVVFLVLLERICVRDLNLVVVRIYV